MGNQLAQENSPYLLQHQHNPVHWYAWGEVAFSLARELQKPIFLSIGYSTCHWCHVMEKDCFERLDVADVLNRHFISIKVDREERPDIDRLYMDVVVTLSGHGGWPLSVFLTPDLKPFYAGTFYWRDQLIQLLQSIAEVWKNDRHQCFAAGEDIIQQVRQLVEPPRSESFPHSQLLEKAFAAYQQQFDVKHGGFGVAPKFPRPQALSFLLRLYDRTKDVAALQMVEITLEHMARGGLFDHLGGGFSRYATDQRWLIPHFEKMLYDNALLATVYLEASQITKKTIYADVARLTLDYVLREMMDAQGGFYSAEDADSEGVEGKFYTWTSETLRSVLTPSERLLIEQTYTSPEACIDGAFILHLTSGEDRSITQDVVLERCREKLQRARQQRVHPLKDDKILVDWNGLMISAMCKGFHVLKDDRYLHAAQKAAHALRQKCRQEKKIFHGYRAGKASIDGMLRDYAYLIAGLLDLYQSDFDASWVTWACELQSLQDAMFWDNKNGGYFYSSDALDDVLVRRKDFEDDALPSGNAVSAINGLKLFYLMGEETYRTSAMETLKVIAPLVDRSPLSFDATLIALEAFFSDFKSIALIGNISDAQAWVDVLHETFMPHHVVAIGERDELPLLQGKKKIQGKTTLYLCTGECCREPLTDMVKAREILLSPL